LSSSRIQQFVVVPVVECVAGFPPDNEAFVRRIGKRRKTVPFSVTSEDGKTFCRDQKSPTRRPPGSWRTALSSLSKGVALSSLLPA